MNETELELQEKALRALHNISEITPELVVLALSEAIELSESKPISKTLLLDLALLRLKLNLKMELSEYEEKHMRYIISKAEAIRVDDSGEANGSFAYGERRSEWDIPKHSRHFKAPFWRP